MIEDNSKSLRARALDSLTTQHLKEAVEREPLTVTTEHIKEALAAESLTTTHLKHSLHQAAAQSGQMHPALSPQPEVPISSVKGNDK